MSVISGKLVSLVLLALAERPHRFSELQKKIGGISQKMLSQTLRQLEEMGFVSRTVKATVPVSVTYAITPLGTSLDKQLAALQQWALDNYPKISRTKK